MKQTQAVKYGQQDTMQLKCDCHINENVNKSYSVLGPIHRNLKYMSSDTLSCYKTSVLTWNMLTANGLHTDEWI